MEKREPILLKQIDLFEEEYSNRLVSYKELIYDNYQYNSILINVQPDNCQYKVRFFEVKDKVLNEEINFHRSIVGAYPFIGEESILLFEISDKTLKVTGKDKIKVKALFKYISLNDSKDIFYIPFLMEKDGELLIEKRVHDIYINSTTPGEAEFMVWEKILDIYKDYRKKD